MSFIVRNVFRIWFTIHQLFVFIFPPNAVLPGFLYPCLHQYFQVQGRSMKPISFLCLFSSLSLPLPLPLPLPLSLSLFSFFLFFWRGLRGFLPLSNLWCSQYLEKSLLLSDAECLPYAWVNTGVSCRMVLILLHLSLPDPFSFPCFSAGDWSFARPASGTSTRTSLKDFLCVCNQWLNKLPVQLWLSSSTSSALFSSSSMKTLPWRVFIGEERVGNLCLFFCLSVCRTMFSRTWRNVSQMYFLFDSYHSIKEKRRIPILFFLD